MRYILFKVHRLSTVVESTQAFVIDHLHIVHIHRIQHIGTVRTGGGIRRSATRLVVCGEGRQYIHRLRICRCSAVGERHCDTLPTHLGGSAVVRPGRTYLHVVISFRFFGILVTRIGGDDRTHTCFVLCIGHIAICRYILGPEHDGVRTTVERRVVTTVRWVGEIIITCGVTCRNRAGIDLSVRAVSVCLHTHDHVR